MTGINKGGENPQPASPRPPPSVRTSSRQSLAARALEPYREAIEKDYSSGLSYAKIAAKYEVTRRDMRLAMGLWGFPPRPVAQSSSVTIHPLDIDYLAEEVWFRLSDRIMAAIQGHVHGPSAEA